MATLADLLGLGSLTQTQAPSTPTGIQTQAAQLPGLDRKSTRLNSSH